MRIAASQIGFEAAHRRTERVEERVELETWRAPDSAPRPDTVTLSQRAIEAGALPSPLDGDAGALPPKLAVVRQVIEDLLGIEIELYEPAPSPSDAPESPREWAPIRRAPSSGAGYELRVLRTRESTERTQVHADGTVRTADGRELHLNLHLDLQRFDRQTTELSLRGGSEAPRRKDPLVINLSADHVTLADERIDFDLDGDGVSERIPNLTRASGFLALDRSGNGRIDDGRELFGARSGDGFAELAALDDDGNGWIDETDAAWSQLRIWRRDADGGESLQGLAEAGVGALHTGQAKAAFEFRDAAQNPVAELRGTGVYLRESGTAGSLQQLDFFV